MGRVVDEVKGLYTIITIDEFRKTPEVEFMVIGEPFLPRVDGVDKVLHQPNAVSPGIDGSGERTWYMHPAQDDNLLVMQGERNVQIYTKEHGRIESFKIASDCVYKNGELVCQGSSMLVWPRGVFHRITSGGEGSITVNLATRYDGFDIRTNFNIYNLDTKTGEFSVHRFGHEDQK
ncbi:MAG: hypothetical protein HN389_02495 [Clostridia bacterium]|nr:hypothetical protein [Clostridia bacterium]